MASFNACLIILALLFVVSEACYAGDDVRHNLGIGEIICPVTCRKLCPKNGTAMEVTIDILKSGCHIECKNLCKRRIPDFVNSEAQYIVEPMSNNFSHYDLNGDNLISLEEFSTADNLPCVEVYDVFIVADTNKDCMLDIFEFKKAPFVR